ncbi:MAG: sialate O-acetylesterase [Planctomycetes bacterium]|nr:sialate O-acetylesterase [Planctomycetota bacterium]
MTTSPDRPLSIVLLLGQSNMAGRGRADPVATEPHPRVLAWSRDDRWVPARDPLHWDKPEAGVGPGLACASALVAADPAAWIGLVPAAVGGTSITVWEPGAQDPVTRAFPYDDALRRARAALRHGVLRGILWHQGEADRGAAARAHYAQRFTTLVARLRAELQAPDVPVVAGELPQLHPDRQADTTAFNGILAGLIPQIPRFAVVGADGLRDGGDRLHLDADSARAFGRRYATALLALERR